MPHQTRAITCPVCGGDAVLAFTIRAEDAHDAEVDPNDVGLMCPSGCRPTVEQVRPLLEPRAPSG